MRQLNMLVVLLVAVGVMGAATTVKGEAVSQSSDGTGGVRVAVVDLFRVLADAKPFLKDREEVRQWIDEEKRGNLQVKSDAIARQRAELESLGQGTDRFRELRNQIQIEELRLEQEFEFLERERLRRINAVQVRAFDRVRAVIAEYSDARGIQLVLQIHPGELAGNLQSELTSEMYLRDVLYHDASLDITDAVIKILNNER